VVCLAIPYGVVLDVLQIDVPVDVKLHCYINLLVVLFGLFFVARHLNIIIVERFSTSLLAGYNVEL
jgi:hypothetical protein